MATTRASGPTAWSAIVNKAFHGNKKIKGGRPKIIISTAGVPDCAATVGTLCWDTTNSDAYICTVAAGTWVKINA